MHQLFNRWLEKFSAKAFRPNSRPVAVTPGVNPRTRCLAMAGVAHKPWDGLETLEPRVLLSSSLPVAAPTGGDAAIIAEPSDTAMPRSAWLWGQDDIIGMLDDAQTRDRVFSTLAEKNIGTVYLYSAQFFGTGPYPIMERTEEWAGLIADLHAQGLKVYALLDSLSVEPDAPVVMNYQKVLDYNTSRTDSAERYDGVNFDIEPWADPRNMFDDNRETLLNQMIDQIEDFMDRKQSQDPGLVVGGVIPFWFDTFSITRDGETRRAHEFIQDRYDYVSVTAFRDFAFFRTHANNRTDGIIPLSQTEIAYAQRIGKANSVVIGVETNKLGNDFVSNLISFGEEGEVFMNRELKMVEESFTGELGFAGFAIQDFQGLEKFSPEVVDVTVSGTQWDQDFLDYIEAQGLGEGGYSIPTGSPDQLLTLPWGNLNQIKLTFSESVDVESDDLSLVGVNVPSYDITGFSYDDATHSATWTFKSPQGKRLTDKLLLVLSDDVTDSEGNALDGEWADSVSSFANGTGDADAGGDFKFRLNLLAGDADRSGKVNFTDLFREVGGSFFHRPGSARYSIFRDLDGDAFIGIADLLIAGRNFTHRLPDAEPVSVVAPPAQVTLTSNTTTANNSPQAAQATRPVAIPQSRPSKIRPNPTRDSTRPRIAAPPAGGLRKLADIAD